MEFELIDTGLFDADPPPVHPEMDNEICGARVGSSRHVAWVLRVIHFGLDALPANPRNRRAIIIGGSIATHLKLLEAMGSIIERFGHATMALGEGVADHRRL
jgi:hypothetical protein